MGFSLIAKPKDAGAVCELARLYISRLLCASKPIIIASEDWYTFKVHVLTTKTLNKRCRMEAATLCSCKTTVDLRHHERRVLSIDDDSA
jgi:hypothetical protein